MNASFLLKRTKAFRFLAILVAFSFLSNSILSAGPVTSSVVYLPKKAEISLEFDKINNLFIPESFGSIVKRWNPDITENNKLIIHIKDAHCNYEAQHNIAKILETLSRDYNIDLVAVEGAAGDLDLSRFGKLEDTKVKEKVTDIFVKRGIVTGPEYLRITKYNEFPFGIYGIEDGQLYVKNFMSFRNTISNAKETQFFIDELTKVTNRLKEKLYSKELLEFDNQVRLYNNNNELSLSNYIYTLYKPGKVNSAPYPNLNTVYHSIQLEEEIDFNRVEKEREQLIRYIEKSLPKEDLEEMVKKSLQYKLGKIPSVEYYSYLGEYINEQNEQNLPNLKKYIQLVKLQAKIDSNELFKEINRIENEIKERLFRNNIERSLDRLSKRISILDKLFHLQLTRTDIQYFKNHKNEFTTSSLLSFIKVQAPLNNIQIHPVFNNKDFLKKVDEYIVPGDRFYEEALLRDETLVENTLKKMEEENKNIAVMISVPS